ncbi:MAG: hypothetical protein AAB464_01765 [Patescibacteria group bacterium]
MNGEQNLKNQEVENSVLPPPEPEIEIRTMASDMEKVKMSGGDLSAVEFYQASSRPAIGKKPALKTFFLIVGIFIMAAIIGFLSYYIMLKIL